MEFESKGTRRQILRDAVKILESVNARAEGTIEGKMIWIVQDVLMIVASNEPIEQPQLEFEREVFGDLCFGNPPPEIENSTDRFLEDMEHKGESQ